MLAAPCIVRQTECTHVGFLSLVSEASEQLERMVSDTISRVVQHQVGIVAKC